MDGWERERESKGGLLLLLLRVCVCVCAVNECMNGYGRGRSGVGGFGKVRFVVLLR